MDLSKITDVNQVRAVIMPVGAISANRFRYFSQLISSFHTLQLSHLTRNVTDKSRTQENLTWKELHSRVSHLFETLIILFTKLIDLFF